MNIIIADDHELILKGMKDLIQNYLPEAIIVEAIDKVDLLNIIEIQKPDIIFQDIRFGKDDARSFLGEIRSTFPDTKIIIISSLGDLHVIEGLLKIGVHGYFFKNDKNDEVLKAIQAIQNDELPFFSSTIKRILAGKKIKEQSILLTKREQEILKLILHEKTSKEIGTALFISEKTVENNRANLFLKFDVRNLAGLVKKAILDGFL